MHFEYAVVGWEYAFLMYEAVQWQKQISLLFSSSSHPHTHHFCSDMDDSIQAGL